AGAGSDAAGNVECSWETPEEDQVTGSHFVPSTGKRPRCGRPRFRDRRKNSFRNACPRPPATGRIGPLGLNTTFQCRQGSLSLHENGLGLGKKVNHPERPGKKRGSLGKTVENGSPALPAWGCFRHALRRLGPVQSQSSSTPVLRMRWRSRVKRTYSAFTFTP